MMTNGTKRTYIDIALVILLAAVVIGGLVTYLAYDAWGTSNVYENEADMDIDFIPQVYMFMEANSKHEFEDFDRVEDGIDHFRSTSEGERCLTGEGEDAEFKNRVAINTRADSVIASWDAPERIYCLTGEPPFVTPMTLQGVVVLVDGNGVGHDAPMHMRDSEAVDCDGEGSEYFGGYEVEPEATGYVTVSMIYQDGFYCDGLPDEGDLIVIVPDYKWFIE
jgi:hypothetical protein